MQSSVRPYTISVEQEVLDDLRARLTRARWPIEPAASPWRYGTRLSWLKGVVSHWLDAYDWRAWEDRLNLHENVLVRADDLDVHVLVARGAGENPLPIVMTHGFPSSIVEFLDLVGPLTDPAAHGGEQADSFTVVLPSLPGYGFSDPPPAPISPRAVAASWARVMEELGFQRYVAYGTDIGAMVHSWLAIDHPGALTAHLLSHAVLRPPLDGLQPSLEEREFLAARARLAPEMGYSHIQGTKPQTLSYGLTDSPVGLAAWILEKFKGWVSVAPADPPPFATDVLLTNVMLYWLKGFNSAAWFYCAPIEERTHTTHRVEVPTGFLLGEDDLVCPPPESWIRRTYDVLDIEVLRGGGHFPAMQHPDVLVRKLRELFRPFRG